MRVSYVVRGVFLVMLAAGLAACGGSPGGEAVASLTVELDDFSFTPDSFTVPAGAEVEIAMTNLGSVTHDFVVMQAGYQATLPFDSDDEPHVYWQAEVPAGETVNFIFDAPGEAGDYEVVCAIQGHLEAGMRGTLTVTQ